MRKLSNFTMITALMIIHILFFTNVSFAQSRIMLSPIVQINNQIFQNGFIPSNPRLPLSFPICQDIESYSLDDLTEQIINRCINGDFSLFKVNWQKKHLNYQQFIKEAAAINTAIKHLLYSKDFNNNKYYSLFLAQAINTRVEMLEKYQSPLSKKGIENINSIKSSEPNISDLETLINPPKEWFIPLLNEQRRKALITQCNTPLGDSGVYNPEPLTPRLVATWGCSTQCDHCDGSAVIEITSFPWNWVEESQTLSPRYICRIKQEPNLNDYFRDYYDFVYDKDASDLIMITQYKFISTSGFAPGSVGERALKKLLPLHHIKAFQVSVAPSAWMRSIINKGGAAAYIAYLKNIKSIVNDYNISSAYSYGKILTQFAIFDFTRVDDNPEMFREIFNYCYRENKSSSNITIWESGNYNRLKKAGLIDIANVKSPTAPFRAYSSNEDLKSFLAGDVANTALFPDGQIARVFIESETILNRAYKTIPGIEPIGREQIHCWYCNKLECKGTESKHCAGKSNVFKNHNLSENGGFDTKFLSLAQSI